MRLSHRLGAVALIAIVSNACAGASDPSLVETSEWHEGQVIALAGPARKGIYIDLYPPDVALAMDGQGRAWAVWARRGPAGVEAARFDTRWHPPATIRSRPDANGKPVNATTGAAVAMNASGEAIVAWVESREDWFVMASELRGDTWSEGIRVQEVPSGGYVWRRGSNLPQRPAVALGADGVGWLFWVQAPYTSYPYSQPSTLKVSRFAPKVGWSPESTLDPPEDYGGSNPAVLPLAGGEVLAAWSNFNGLQSARLSATRGETRRTVAQMRGTRGPTLAPRPGGGAVLGWATWSYEQSRIGTLSIQALAPDLTFEAPVEVAAGGTGVPVVALSPTGAVFVTWLDGDRVWARVAADVRQPLGAPIAIGEGVTPAGLNVAADARGNAIVVWRDASPRLIAVRFTPAEGWGTPAVLHTGRTGTPITDPALAMDGHGHALVAFSGVSPTEEAEIRAVRFIAAR
jgi:hypothetical protein